MAKRKTKLQKCFEEFNGKYFDDRLHDVSLSWADKPKVDGSIVSAYCYCPDDLYKEHRIVLARNLMRRSWMWQLVLLHEMVHLDLYLKGTEEDDFHGPLFNAEMLRLAKIGALNGLW